MDEQDYLNQTKHLDNESHWAHFGLDHVFHKETMWQNEHMNTVQARKFIFDYFYNEDFFQKMNYLTANYDMGSFGYGKKNVEQRIISTATRAMYFKKDDAFIFDTTKQIFMEDYKRRKLSL